MNLKVIVLIWALTLCVSGHAEIVNEKVLICGVCKNIEKAVPNTIQSAKALGAQFLDYRVVIYENNSTDQTQKLLHKWAENDARVIFISENLTKKELAGQLQMKVCNRTEGIARARNKVLDVIMQDQYEDFKYVIWADLDFLDPWDVQNIVDTLLHPEQEWDAVLANGAYDLFAFRDSEFPIGFELIGAQYWQRLDEIRTRFSIHPTDPWRKVYSAFGGLGIYKREAIKGCRYSGVVTKDLEKAVTIWLEKAAGKKDICFLSTYQDLLTSTPIIDLTADRISNRKHLPLEIGVRLNLETAVGDGKLTQSFEPESFPIGGPFTVWECEPPSGNDSGSKSCITLPSRTAVSRLKKKNGIVWFSCTRKKTLPWTCEHIPFHASMILRGHDKIFINPRLISNHPE